MRLPKSRKSHLCPTFLYNSGDFEQEQEQKQKNKTKQKTHLNLNKRQSQNRILTTELAWIIL